MSWSPQGCRCQRPLPQALCPAGPLGMALQRQWLQLSVQQRHRISWSS